ncbi:histidine phosphotransferase [Aurantiacibacter atlanticus]|uniref:Histidine phosphotransferase n=1 Tax=Aurantiacibacter atlanticus TaxID=1648404 RepID=A0A0H4VDF5_9SPHN|nr:histidine phosphotransferase family protein [Aurantiacibacter atlanticus]AKQ42697.1 histidine phosphotransferase [Aurantiacibacter atlanticus]MDF1834431.1 histidine phosphotransferase family protein [Alteraurantiacibacter sp. bin_em_oilr2.035]
MTSSLDLAALLCSRLCHDMLSPVGALNNGLELLADENDPAMRQRCLDLLEQSASTSASKLKFFRLAYGAAGGFGDRVPSQEPRELLESLTAHDERVTLEWSVTESSLPKPAIKVLLNLAAMGLESLVRGGTLEVGAECREGATEIAIRASGPKVVFDPVIGKALSGQLAEEELSGRTAPAHMIRLVTEQQDGGVQFAHSADALVLGAVLPDPEGMIG